MKQKIIDEILTSKRKLFLAITGGGTAAIPLLLQNGGASDVFLGAIVPYCHKELMDVVGSTDKTVSERVALLLSGTAYNRAIADDFTEGPGKECVGIGATSSLVKNTKEREGREHKVYLAVSIIETIGKSKQETVEVTLKANRTRKEEEDVVSNLILLLADMNLCLRKAHWFHPTFRKALNTESGLTDQDEVKWCPLQEIL